MIQTNDHVVLLSAQGLVFNSLQLKGSLTQFTRVSCRRLHFQSIKKNTAILEYTNGKMCSWNGRAIRWAVAQLDTLRST